MEEKILDTQVEETVEDNANEALAGDVYENEDEAIEAMIDDRAGKAAGVGAGAIITLLAAGAVAGGVKLVKKIKAKKAEPTEEQTADEPKEEKPKKAYCKLTLKERLTGRIEIPEQKEEDEEE